VSYLVLVQGDTWALSRDDLARELRARWPDVVVRDPTDGAIADPARDLEWYVGAGSSRVDGSAHVSGQCIYVDGQNQAVAPVVAWFRQLVPSEQHVTFCDDTYSFDLELDPAATSEWVLNYLESL
jgi:hypothetical protein